MHKTSILTTMLPILLGLTLIETIYSQSRDTVLNMVISKPNFYNVVKSSEGRIFAGTSEGIIEMKGVDMKQYNRTIGYLTLDKYGKPVIDSNGIRYHSEKKYYHLLPFPEMAREEYHASSDNTFYICSGGRMYIFDILPYEYSYANHSFRTISKDLLGTYSGIYLKGKKLGYPVYPFTDGYIRQFEDRAFICNYNIIILEKDALDTGILQLGKNCREYGPEKQFYNDIFYAPKKRYYYIATQQKLVRTDYDFNEFTTLFEYNGKNGPIGFATEDERSLLFFADNILYQLFYANEKVESLVTLEETIMAAVFIEKQVYLLTKKGLYRFNSGQQTEKLIDIENAHTMIAHGGSELILGSDHGLYLFNIVSKALSVVIKGVEFNRRALYEHNNTIYAGSINGMYSIQANDLPKIIEENKAQLKKDPLPKNIGIIIAVSLLIIFILTTMILWLRSKLKKAETVIENIKVPNKTVTKDIIEEFIRNNLPNASIKTIIDEFDLNPRQLYAILKPDKPGTNIQNIRLNSVKQMREEGKTSQEISKATGLSISYLKKIK
jgi:hypothetical protein